MGVTKFETQQEAEEEEEKCLRDGVERGTIHVGPREQDLLNPVEGLGELVAPAVLVEETQDVAAHDWIDSVLEVGEEGLRSWGCQF